MRILQWLGNCEFYFSHSLLTENEWPYNRPIKWLIRRRGGHVNHLGKLHKPSTRVLSPRRRTMANRHGNPRRPKKLWRNTPVIKTSTLTYWANGILTLQKV